MNDKQIREAMRERVARWLYYYTTPGMSGESGADASCNPELWGSCPILLKEKYRRDADQVLSIRFNDKLEPHEKGRYRIEIIDEEGGLPFPTATIRMNDPHYQDGAMIHTQKLMLEANFRKIVGGDK